MRARFICLANSLKEGGRCLAGIEVDERNQPRIINNRPKWIRPVCHTTHGEVPVHIAIPFRLLDIIEIDDIKSHPHPYQTENVLFDTQSLRACGKFETAQLRRICEVHTCILGNKGKALSPEAIAFLDHSLMLISTDEFEVIKKIYPEKPNRPQIRLAFIYMDTNYELPVTDPEFRDLYLEDSSLLKGVQRVYLCLSIGIPWEGWYYKLVASIIY